MIAGTQGNFGGGDSTMLLFKKVMTVALAGGLSLAGSQAVQAAPIVGTGSVSVVGVTGTPPGLIGVDTTFSFTLSLWSGGSGEFTPVEDELGPGLIPLVTQSITATVGTPVSFIADWGTFVGTVTQASASGPTSNRVVDVFALGTFTPDVGPPDLSGYTPGPMSLTFSATQTGGADGSISASYTIASPPADVPEPLTMSLFGLGLVGSAVAARRRRS